MTTVFRALRCHTNIHRNWTHFVFPYRCMSDHPQPTSTRNVSGELAESRQQEKKDSIHAISAIAECEEFFNHQCRIESIKEEFEMELQALHSNKQQMLKSCTASQIHAYIGRTTHRLKELHANHQLLHTLHMSASRELENLRAKKDENVLKFYEKYREMNGDVSNGYKGKYHESKVVGLKLITEYQHFITECYQHTAHAHVSPN
mmetsp:Transcript_9216/g.14151  ORF Transcript_9216/g.14151 Transcript_9216/m.14151 type:complete len:204 (-) Transcript_9216:96-707(-)|eukprot:CAMPEP_0202692990 /NCGR_PEP_ID=MMETSP1385-20130828/7230_1 /ASSEMBLY_ACC=CAM_ASM_000861 /TAXON_ID=933848 /ORGANISM="Elphidium margaritaceum" /LENGTH=203 /DNA_ID=CAMNT_0049348609 /DNA_START=24 /DNA_END=635 /DNA_ORIENTATION=+